MRRKLYSTSWYRNTGADKQKKPLKAFVIIFLLNSSTTKVLRNIPAKKFLTINKYIIWKEQEIAKIQPKKSPPHHFPPLLRFTVRL